MMHFGVALVSAYQLHSLYPSTTVHHRIRATPHVVASVGKCAIKVIGIGGGGSNAQRKRRGGRRRRQQLRLAAEDEKVDHTGNPSTVNVTATVSVKQHGLDAVQRAAVHAAATAQVQTLLLSLRPCFAKFGEPANWTALKPTPWPKPEPKWGGGPPGEFVEL